MRLPDPYEHLRHSIDFQRSCGNTIGKILQIANVPVGENRGDKIVQLAVINYTFRAVRDFRALHRDRNIDFNRLGYLGLVGKDTDARVKAHRLKRDDVEVVHLDQLSRAFLIERTRENASSRRVEAA